MAEFKSVVLEHGVSAGSTVYCTPFKHRLQPRAGLTDGSYTIVAALIADGRYITRTRQFTVYR